MFAVISRYHGGAFVVFSKQLNENLEVVAVEGSYASVIGGAPAAAVVFAREVDARTKADPRVVDGRPSAMARLAAATTGRAAGGGATTCRRSPTSVRSEKLGEVAEEFDEVHSIQRALEVGSVDRIIPAASLRPYLVDALERGMAGTGTTSSVRTEATEVHCSGSHEWEGTARGEAGRLLHRDGRRGVAVGGER